MMQPKDDTPVRKHVKARDPGPSYTVFIPPYVQQRRFAEIVNMSNAAAKLHPVGTLVRDDC